MTVLRLADDRVAPESAEISAAFRPPFSKLRLPDERGKHSGCL